MTPPAFAVRVSLVGAFLYALAAYGPARAEWLIHSEVGLVHDNNLTRAANADAIRSDHAWTASASAGYVFVPATAGVLTIGAVAAAERYARYRPLDHVAIGLRAFYRHKLALGANVPYVIATAAVARDDYRDELRDSDRADGYVELGRRFDTAFDAAIGAGFDRRDQHRPRPVAPGIPGDVFDLRGNAAWVRASHALADDVEIGARVGVRRGDVESTAHRGQAIFRASDAVAADTAFGNDELFAYRLRATTWSAGATLSWALTPHCAVNAAYLGERTSAAGGIEYRSRIARITLSTVKDPSCRCLALSL
jgi:hypothetical protein